MVSSEEARRVTDWRRERGKMGDCRAEGSTAVGDGGQAAMSLTPDADGTCMSIFESLHLQASYIGGLTTWT